MANESQYDFSAGMFRDMPGHLIPENGCYDAVDLLFDKRGLARKRGGATAVVSGAQTAYAGLIGAIPNDELANGGTLYGHATVAVGSNGFVRINRTTGAITEVMNGNPASGRPFNHLGFIFFPCGVRAPEIAAGATGAKSPVSSFTTPASLTITAGDPTITTHASDPTSGFEVGQILIVEKGSSPTYTYAGRITAITGAQTLTVWPTPEYTFTPSAASTWNALPQVTSGTREYGGYHGVSFQNRVMLFNTTLKIGSTARVNHPTRFIWTTLPGEPPSTNTSTATDHGATWLFSNSFEPFNYADVADAEPFRGAVVVGDDQVLLFGRTKSHLLTGELITHTSLNKGSSYSVDPVPKGVGLLSARSIQRTSRGIIFASHDGVYVYDGSEPVNIMEGTLASYWQSALPGMTVEGSAVLGGKVYMLSVGTGAPESTTNFFLNLDTGAWSRSKSTSIRIFDSVPDPSDEAKVWALRWYDTGAGAPSMTNGQAVRIDTLRAPSGSTINEADGATAVTSELITRAYTAGEPERVKTHRHARFAYDLRTAGTVTVTEAATLDPGSGTYASLNAAGSSTTLPLTSAPSVKGFSDYTKEGVGIAYKITQTGAPDKFEIAGIEHQYRVKGVVEVSA